VVSRTEGSHVNQLLQTSYEDTCLSSTEVTKYFFIQNNSALVLEAYTCYSAACFAGCFEYSFICLYSCKLASIRRVYRKVIFAVFKF